MEIKIGKHSQIHKYLGIVLALFSLKVSGSIFQKHPSTDLNSDSNKDVTVYAGDTAVLKCSVDNSGPKSIAWRKVSQEFPLSVGQMMYAPNDEMSIDYQEKDHRTHVNLVIKKTKTEHAGIYECQLIASEVKLHHVKLTVLKERPVLKHSITLDGSVYLSPKQRLNLTCNATGTTRAPEFIDWFHNGNLIDERKPQWQNRAVITSYRPEVPGRSLISILTVEHVTPADAGVYVCRSMTPSINTGVDTTSIVVHILNAEKDHMKKREGYKSEKAFDMPKDNSNPTVRISGDCNVIILLILVYFIS